MVSNLDKTRRRAKIKCLHFIFRDDEVFSRREIDAQKRVIFEIKSPFNLRLEPEFSTGSHVGEGRPDVVARLCMVVDWWLLLGPQWLKTMTMKKIKEIQCQWYNSN